MASPKAASLPSDSAPLKNHSSRKNPFCFSAPERLVLVC
nr:MAG TPA: hypothetical protein [Caudoviricetes sp.]DAL88160.1 MAG TPA: hypothetical protein [Caudoviricetes sp.]